MDKKITSELFGHQERIAKTTLRKLFEQDPKRAEHFSLEACGIVLDYSKNQVDDAVMSSLTALAMAADVPGKTRRMFAGERINNTEDRAVLHTALRRALQEDIKLEGQSISWDIRATLKAAGDFAERVRSGVWKGSTGKPIRNVVNIGIGGSDLGVEMVYEALRFCSQRSLSFRFVSNVDPNHLLESLQGLDLAETLFIICSKTFTTQETLSNARLAQSLMKEAIGEGFDGSKHFAAVSSFPDRAKEFGIDEANVFPMWDWVGGRYSICSAVGLAVMVSIGEAAFREFLEGASAMDEHFLTAPIEKNMPALMALIGIWHNNFWGCETHAVLPYSIYMKRFPAYLQQADMESNGKRVRVGSGAVEWQTGPVIWGEPGTNGQHSFYQHIHQGTKLVPMDFIGFIRPPDDAAGMHNVLMSHFFAQQEALAFGRTQADVEAEEKDAKLAPFKVMPGGRPSNCILADELSPRTVGALIALYEHKIFSQGVIWDINSFDQWGVELGKKKASTILSEITAGKVDPARHDASTASLITRYLSRR